MRELVGFVVLLSSGLLFAEGRIVYGVDSRVDIKNVFDAKVQEISRAVAGRVHNYSFNPLVDDGSVVAFDRVLSLSHPRSMNVCSDEKFASQPTVSDCTGFLIAEDLLVTAGHCVVRQGETVKNEVNFSCESNSWAFDYREGRGKESLDLNKFDGTKIYGCKKVIYGVWEEDNDYALIQLDRKVTDRKPLKMNASSRVRPGSNLFILGHPSGLPLKYADGGKVFEVKKNYFATNLDSFAGNSGSPVFNKTTLAVEGILVRGDVDYKESMNDDGSSCLRVNTCNNNREKCIEDNRDIKGEHVSHISKVLELI